MNTRRSYLGHDIPGYAEQLLKAISRYGLPPGASRAWFRDPDFQVWNSLGYMQPSGSIYWQTYLYAALQAAGVDQHHELSTITDVRRSKPAPSCLASASYVRSRRIGVLGSILDLVRNNPELDVAWLTAGDYNSRFDPKASWPSAIPGARMRFEHQLERSGALTAPGFLIAYLHGYFLPDVKAFQLQYRGIVGGQKLKCIHEWGKLRRNGEVAPSQINIAIHVIRDLVQQISGMMHNFLPATERTATGDISSLERMTEPYDSVYLIWLSQHSLADMLILNGAFYLDGRLVLAECCNAVASRPISRSPHVSRPSIRPGRQRGRKLQSVPGSRILRGV